MNLTVTEENGLSIDVEVSDKFRWQYDKPDFVAAFDGNDLVGTVRPLYKINEPVKRRFSHTTDYRNKKEVFEIKDYKAKEFAFVDDWQEEYPLSRAVRYLNALLTDEVTPANPDRMWMQTIRHRQQPLALFDWLGKYWPWYLRAFENTIRIVDVGVKWQDLPTAEPTVFVLPNFYYVIHDLFNNHLTIVHTETRAVIGTVCKRKDENGDLKSSNPFAYWNGKTNVIVDTFDTMTPAIAGLIKELQC